MTDLQSIPLEQMHPNPDQPRRHFSDAEIGRLAESLQRQGQLVPVLVTPRDDAFLIVGGERRWRAARLAGLSELRCVVRDMTDEEVEQVALIENIQRAELLPLEEAAAIKRLAETLGRLLDCEDAKCREVSRSLGKSLHYVRQRLRLTALEPTAAELPQARELSLPQLLPIVGLPPALHVHAVQHVFRKGLHGPAVLRYCQRLKQHAPTLFSLTPTLNSHQRDLEVQIERFARKAQELRNAILLAPWHVTPHGLAVLESALQPLAHAARAIGQERRRGK